MTEPAILYIRGKVDAIAAIGEADPEQAHGLEDSLYLVSL